MSFLDEISKFRADAEAMPTAQLSSLMVQVCASMKEMREIQKNMPRIVAHELMSRQSAYLDTIEQVLGSRWLPVAPSVRIAKDGALVSEGYRAALVSFYLGEKT